VHLVCFIIRIYHEARSPARQIRNWYNFFNFLKMTNALRKAVLFSLKAIPGRDTLWLSRDFSRFAKMKEHSV